eukprot:1134617-Pleurochrysis_carterae.AAC.1
MVRQADSSAKFITKRELFSKQQLESFAAFDDTPRQYEIESAYRAIRRPLVKPVTWTLRRTCRCTLGMRLSGTLFGCLPQKIHICPAETTELARRKGKGRRRTQQLLYQSLISLETARHTMPRLIFSASL